MKPQPPLLLSWQPGLGVFQPVKIAEGPVCNWEKHSHFRPGPQLKHCSPAPLLTTGHQQKCNSPVRGTGTTAAAKGTFFDIVVSVGEKILSFSNLDSHIAQSCSNNTVIFWKTCFKVVLKTSLPVTANSINNRLTASNNICL